MTQVTVFGGTGYAGANIARALSDRGLEATSISRSAPTEAIAGVAYEVGSLTEPSVRERALTRSDVVIVAVSPRGAMAGKTRQAIAELAEEAESSGVRVGVIGGAGSLLLGEGAGLLLESDGFPAAFAEEAREMAGVLEDLRKTPERLDWFFVSPASGFGAYAPGTFRGEYRVGGDILLTDDEGNSEIGGADFGVAIADEIAHPRHHRQRFTVAY